MKIIFWNIGERFTDNKKSYLAELLRNEKPEFCCIAEGTYSQNECDELENTISFFGFEAVYTPRTGKDRNFGFGYKKNGLKIFKSKEVTCQEIQFEHQRNEGRIIRLDTIHNETNLSIFFIHNRSKSGNREVTDEQRLFMSDISMFIKSTQNLNGNMPVMIMGDFNLEPWDNILRTKGYFMSNFLTKHFNFQNRKVKNEINYFNPIAEKVIEHGHENLGGTYYSKNYGWALYDYVIYDKNRINLEFQIITSTLTTEFLKKDLAIDEILSDEIDHLPILAKII